MIRTTIFLRGMLAAGALLTGMASHAAGGAAILQKDCAGCHNLTGPAPATLEALKARKGPDLFYAGNKYRREWLAKWLQNPQRIRPSGMLYVNHVKPGAKHDEIDTSQLADHAKLVPADAAAVADALMKLRAHDDLIAKEKIEAGTISTQMGEMVFDKFSGCLACHLVEPEYGGVSGPELYTAAERLTPEFIASFTRNPQAWDPKTWMPNKHISDQNLQKLVRYFDALAKESKNGN
jgi:mono/diheme cytochrome c family protein